MIRHAIHRALFVSAAAALLAAPAAAQTPQASQTGPKRLKSPASIPFIDDNKKPAPAASAGPGAAPAAPKKAAAGVPLLPGSGSKEPVNITADKLDFLNKENKLIYTGSVVVVQGDSTMKASKLNIDLQKDAAGGATAPATPVPAAPGPDAAPAAGNSSVRHMEADGPVTLISKDQVGTGDHATYDKGENKVYLNGNVTLSQGTNVTQGDRLIYDMTSGQAQVFSGQTGDGRVHSVFTPGSGGPPGGAPAAKPAPAPAPPKSKQRSAKGGGEAASARDAEAMR